jgi:hypothetical protein
MRTCRTYVLAGVMTATALALAPSVTASPAPTDNEQSTSRGAVVAAERTHQQFWGESTWLNPLSDVLLHRREESIRLPDRFPRRYSAHIKWRLSRNRAISDHSEINRRSSDHHRRMCAPNSASTRRRASSDTKTNRCRSVAA